MNFENFKPVVDFEEYYLVSNLGDVYSIRSKKLMKQQKQKNGYLTVDLQKCGKVLKQGVHRVVAKAFIEKRCNKYNQVNHKNGIKTDNRAENLEWCTAKKNIMHAIKNGLIDNAGAKNKTSRGIICLNTGEKFECMRDAGKKYNLSYGNITSVCQKKRKDTKGYCFEYL